MLIPSERALLQQLEALAVGALAHGGVGLVGAHLNGVQAAVLLVLAVMGAGIDAAVDGAVGRAGAAAVGAIAQVCVLLIPVVFGCCRG